MTKFLLLAGAAALAATSPLAAKPGKGHGHGGDVKVVKVHTAKSGKVKAAKVKTLKVKTAKLKTAKVKTAKVKAKWLTPCPPGLVWHGEVCMPKPHAAWVPELNSRVPLGWAYTPWNRIPTDLRSRYVLDPGYRYIYRDGLVYVVDPETRLITSILSAVL